MQNRILGWKENGHN